MYEKFDNSDDNFELYRYYGELLNYKTQICEGDEYIYIFFTSHGLYYPTTLEEFKKQVVENDRYEWENISKNKKINNRAIEYIFIRDIYKSWCLQGINREFDTIDKVADFLAEKLKGKKVITVGSSAGGYMAIVFGLLIKASAIYAFAPQISLEVYDRFHEVKYLSDYKIKSEVSQYLSLQKLLDDNVSSEVFAIFPTMCEEDAAQLEIVESLKNERLHVLKVKYNQHGTPIYGESVVQILGGAISENVKLFTEYSKRELSRGRVLMETSGVCRMLAVVVGSSLKCYIRGVKRFIKK